jgi:lysozyme family protein
VEDEEGMRPDFDLAFEERLMLEKGYADHPSDGGGKTMYGITEEVAKRHNYTGEMRKLPLQIAKAIYLSSYWNKLDCGVLVEHKVASYVFGMAVNHGPMGATGGATRIVQRAVNRVWRYEPHHHIRVDGFWGPQTLSAVQALAIRYPGSILGAMKHERGLTYERICDARVSQRDFWKGWLREVA